MSKTTKQAAKHLGKKTGYSSIYDPSLLVKVDREENRKNYGILPGQFVGVDVWNCYEVSFLKPSKLPVVGKLKIIYPSSSKCIVESKSLKLYLNSFNNTVVNDVVKEGDKPNYIGAFQEIVRTDLEKLLGVEVKVKLFTGEGSKEIYTEFLPALKLENIVKDEGKEWKFAEAEFPEVLTYNCEGKEEQVYNLYWSELLRSNCRVTSQPDWGDCFIKIRSKYKISEESLLRYLISFRNENHFHEEVCEMIYHRLLTAFKPSLLMVGCVYTRRGGIDIVPIRANREDLLEQNLIDISSNNVKLYRQ